MFSYKLPNTTSTQHKYYGNISPNVAMIVSVVSPSIIIGFRCGKNTTSITPAAIIVFAKHSLIGASIISISNAKLFSINYSFNII